MIGDVRDRVIEAILRYGDKCRLILEVALELSERNNELGDFSSKELIDELAKRGYEINPSLILRNLEKEFGIITTTYRTSNQHWWKFIDAEKVREVIQDKEEDPEVALIRTQVASLDLQTIEGKLDFMLRKERLTDVDKMKFREIAFNVLPLIVDVYKKTLEREETYEIASKLKKIILMAEQVSKKMEKESTKEFRKNTAYTLRQEAVEREP
ncbi:hypothetical protein HS7_16530 [Sulfolobales archaeon HS-7]|nr:hypothetical protein HS7_16530 [Sulfolobales archaeon HS-7]